jgi:hypothetical protein
MKSELGFGEARFDHRFVRPKLTENRTIEINGCRHFGLLSAQVGVGIADPGLCCFKIRAAGWVTGHVLFLGRTGISCWARFGLRIFKCFSFSEIGINLFN